MTASDCPRPLTPAGLLPLLRRHWGYDGYLADQEAAVAATLAGHDSVVVLPTGGGKSLCFQLPALALEGTAVVVSPLLALMKDQVDALLANGLPAAALNSALSPEERRDVVRRVRAGEVKLLYLSPERLAGADFRDLLAGTPISFFAIDEAHCISQWGHEFRPDYRRLAQLREWFPDTAIHAFTATATEAVRADIARSLGLREPRHVVGSFDRPNLVFRARHRRDVLGQVREVIERHRGEAGIVYCVRRKDVDALAGELRRLGYAALPYHAGMEPEARRQNQEAFSNERVDIIVATVAFGMGIDRSDVRYVVHAAMPKSIEAYQQEAGRAGRDRLEAECVLLYDLSDLVFWKKMYDPAVTEYDFAALRKVEETYRFARTLACRHRFLVEYFGQAFHREGCGACDVCLGEHAVLEDSLTVARKILSGVARVRQGFGARYVAEVLKGSNTARIRNNGHHTLSTYGLLSAHALDDIGDWVEQLVSQGFLEREPEHGTLRFTTAGEALLRGEGTVRLSLPEGGRARTREALSGEEEQLFQRLRELRRHLAQERGVPPYLVLGDVTLRDLARTRPGSTAALLRTRGIGEAKARDFGPALLECIAAWCREAGVPAGDAPGPAPAVEEKQRNPQKSAALAALAEGASIEEVAARTGRASSTVWTYLAEHLAETGATSGVPWLDEQTVERVVTAARELKAEALRPIYDALREEVPYGAIRVALVVGNNRRVREARR